jgi:hypothetical protein
VVLSSSAKCKLILSLGVPTTGNIDLFVCDLAELRGEFLNTGLLMRVKLPTFLFLFIAGKFLEVSVTVYDSFTSTLLIGDLWLLMLFI